MARNYFNFLTNSPAISSNDLLRLYQKIIFKNMQEAKKENNKTKLLILENIEDEVKQNLDNFLFNPKTSKREKEEWYYVNRVLDISKEKETSKEPNQPYKESLINNLKLDKKES